jgi:uncharacterized protein YdbL (DUF1318 family)
MLRRILLMSAVVVALPLFSDVALAVDQEQTQERVQMHEQEQVYGSQLMTQQERTKYRAQMNAAKSEEEREQIRREHHERMKERAKAQGVNLPDEPSVGGRGMGRESTGMGPGRSRAGSGGGRGR